MAEAEKTFDSANTPAVRVESGDGDLTLIMIEGTNRPGLLGLLTSTFADLGLDVVKAEIGGSGKAIHDRFWVMNADGKQLQEDELAAVRQTLEVTLASYQPGSSRPKLTTGPPSERSELLHTLMGAWRRMGGGAVGAPRARAGRAAGILERIGRLFSQ